MTVDLRECLLALVRVDSGLIGAVSWPDPEPSVKDLGVCNPRGTRQLRQRCLYHHHAGQSPKPLIISLLKHYTPHSSLYSQLPRQLQYLTINFSSSNRVLATISL